jgi:uncharacterized protein (TIGR03437 family)
MKTDIFLKALALVLLAAVVPGRGSQLVPKNQAGVQNSPPAVRDYLRADGVAAGGGTVARVAPVSPAKRLKSTPPVTASTSTAYQLIYTSFGGATFTLTAFDGRYVRLALPDTWIGDTGLNGQQVAEFLDLSDLAYAHMAEITSGEPLDNDGPLLTVAFVPSSGPSGQDVDGMGLIGRKGVEINPRTLDTFKAYLAAGLVPDQLLHELAHNFDLYDLWLTYGHDWPHAWTNFLITYTRVYSRSGTLQWDADALLEKNLVDYLGQWKAAGQTATWEACVRDQQCPGVSPNDVWAGFLLTYAKYHGPAALKGATGYLKGYKADHPSPTGTADEDNDLLIEALARGANENITGDADRLRWKVSDAERAGLVSRFPIPSPYSLDRDGDAFTPLDGDADDSDAGAHPGAAEVQNGKDDDCNGLVDEVVASEPGDFPSFAWEQTATLSAPARLVGSHNSAQDLDAVRLDVLAPRFVRFTLKTAPQSNVTLDIRHQSGQGQITQVSGSGLMSKTVFLDRPGAWWLQVSAQPGASFGPYDVLVDYADSTASPVALSVGNGAAPNTLTVTAKIDLQRKFSAPPTHVRLWARGTGFIREMPASGTVSFDWTPPDGNLDSLLRAQLLSSGVPISPVTAAVNRSSALPPDVAVRPVVSFPAAVSNLETVEFKFELSNRGQAGASGVSVSFTLPQGMTLAGVTADRGQIITTGNFIVLVPGALAPSEFITLTVRATGWGLAGTFVGSASASSSGVDGDPANNTSELPVMLRQPQAPPSLEQKVYRLPLRPAGSLGVEVLAQGALARVVVPASGLSLQQPVYAARSQSGAWPTSLVGLDVAVGGQPAVILAVTAAPAGGGAYAVDFVVPDATQMGTGTITVHHALTSRSWDYSAQIRESAPALWAEGGLAQGQAVAQSADDYTEIGAPSPATADGKSRVALYATGIRKLSQSGGLTLRARTAAGVETQLPVEYAGQQGYLPGLDQLILRLPATMAGSGRVIISIDGSPESSVLLQIK